MTSDSSAPIKLTVDEYALTKACKVYHDAKGYWADMTIRKCIEVYLEHAGKESAHPIQN